MFRNLLTIWLVVGCASAEAAIYKCVGKDGVPAYQNTACDQGVKAERIVTEQERLELQQAEKRALERAMEDAKRPQYGYACRDLNDKSQLIGLSRTEVVRWCGEPDRSNERVSRSGNSEMMFYGRGWGYIHLTNGEVTSWGE